MQNRTHAAALCALAGFTLAAGASITTPHAYEQDAGWSPYANDWFGKIRHVKSDRADWELGVGTNESSPAGTTQATWAGSGMLNTFTLDYTAATNTVNLEFNGNSASFAATTDFNALAIQSVARNGRNSIDLTFSDFAFNGNALLPSLASSLDASSSGTNSRYLILTGAGLTSDNDWTLTGKVQADYTGNAPSRDHTKVVFGGLAVAAVGEPIPAPGAIAALTLTGLLGLRRKRPI